MLAKAQRSAFLELLGDFIKEFVIVLLVDDEFRYVSLFCLLDEVVQPAIVVKRLGRRLDHHRVSFHLGLVVGDEEVLELHN